MKVIDLPLKYKDGTNPKVLMFSLRECVGWGGMNVCDLCNSDICTKTRPYGYMTPVLGSMAICKKCYDDFIKKGKLYEEDRPYVDDTLINTYLQFNRGD